MVIRRDKEAEKCSDLVWKPGQRPGGGEWTAGLINYFSGSITSFSADYALGADCWSDNKPFKDKLWAF